MDNTTDKILKYEALIRIFLIKWKYDYADIFIFQNQKNQDFITNLWNNFFDKIIDLY